MLEYLGEQSRLKVLEVSEAFADVLRHLVRALASKRIGYDAVPRAAAEMERINEKLQQHKHRASLYRIFAASIKVLRAGYERERGSEVMLRASRT